MSNSFTFCLKTAHDGIAGLVTIAIDITNTLTTCTQREGLKTGAPSTTWVVKGLTASTDWLINRGAVAADRLAIWTAFI